MKREEAIARDVFQQYGLGFGSAVRAVGWTNAVWLNGDLALRVSLRKDSDSLGRELQLSKFLPKEVGYPPGVAEGATDGFAWSLSKRVLGEPLSSAWCSLTWGERLSAVKQIIDIVGYVHAVDVCLAEPIAKKTAWYSAFSREQSLASVADYVGQRLLTHEQGCEMYRLLDRFYAQHVAAKPVLNHGDITMDNLLWHQGHVTSLMDFEHAVIAPPELDYHALVNLALLPVDDRPLRRGDDDETREYMDAVTGLLTSLFSRSESRDLVLGCAILFRQRFVDFWRDSPEGDIAQLDAYVTLCSLVDGSNGYLGSVLAQ